MLKIKKYFKCLKFCKYKSFLIFSIILMILCLFNNSYIILNSSKIIDNIGTDNINKYLKISLGLFLINVVLNFLISYINKFNFIKTKLSLTNRFLINWLNLSQSERNKFQTGEVNVIIEKDINEISTIATSSLIDIIRLALGSIINIILIGNINLFLLPIIIIFTIINFFKIQKKIYSDKDALEKQNEESLKLLNSCLIGMYERYDYLKIYNLYDWSKKEILNKLKDNYDLREKENTLSTLASRLAYLPGWICEFLFYIIGGILVVKGYLSIGLLFASITFITQIMLSTQQFNLKLSSIGISLNSYERVKSFINNKIDIFSKKILNEEVLNVENLNFNYSLGSNVISNLSFKIPLKGLLLINGKNGSGKSTLINLILGLEKPTNGIIKLGNIASNDFTLSFIYENFSCSFQDVYLFGGTSKENIIFENEYNIEKLDEILNEKFFSEVKNINIKQNGEGASGGEKKRISFARSLYKESRILILDEIDSGLDKEGFDELIHIINKIKKDKLIIIISHNNIEKFKDIIDYIINL